jgi:lysophospholipase L1-like esterase
MRLVSRRIFHRFCRTPISRISVAAAVLLVSAACDKLLPDGNKSPTAPSGPPAAGSAIVYTAIGASDANGVGSSVPCVPFTDCPDGKGYVPTAVRTLKAQGFTVTLRNLGIPTAVIGADFEALGRQYGRTIEGNFIDQEMPFVLTNSTIVTIFAGPNDVNTITAALGAGAGREDPAAYVDAQVTAFGTDYTTLLNGVRDRAPSTRIVVINVPNMGALPYLSGASLSQRQAAQRAAVGMTRDVVNPLAGRGIAVVDAMCDSRTYTRANYSSDGMHPNDSGYAFLASEIVRAVTSSSYPAPQSSCAGMTMVP